MNNTSPINAVEVDELLEFKNICAQHPDNLIVAIHRRVEEIAEAGGEVFDGLKQGDAVLIGYGPFEGYEAIFDARVPIRTRARPLAAAE